MSKNNQAFKIPDELLLFLKNETYSLLIKGEPGIGKTALCLAILRELNIKNNFFYISTRVSPNKLFYYFKWVNKYLKIKSSNLHNKFSKTEPTFGSFFEDARLDEPESLFERITNQLMDVRAPLIIVDSWDGVASFMDRESRLNNERVLQTWLERAGGRLILVGEGTATSTLDYLVDGVVTLRNINYYGRDLREISLNKLRGINVIKNSYLFTLHEGMFKTFESYRDPCSPSIQISKPDLDKSANLSTAMKFSSGYEIIDRDFNGGFLDKSVVLIEYDPRIGINPAIIFLSQFISESMKKLYSIFLNYSLKNSYSLLLNQIIKNHNDDLIRYINFFKKSRNNSENDQYVSKNMQSYDFIDEIEKFKLQSPVFSIIDIDRDQKIDPASLESLKNHMNITFMIKTLDVSNKYSGLIFPDFHFQLVLINGVLCVNLLHPLSKMYVLEVNKEKNNVKLIEI